MPWTSRSPDDDRPDDPIGAVVAACATEIFGGAEAELLYTPVGAPVPDEPQGPAVHAATGTGPPGWLVTLVLRVRPRIAVLVTPDSTALLRILQALPRAALRAATRFRALSDASRGPLSPATRRAVRDTVAIELLGLHLGQGAGKATTHLIADTLEYLIELSGTRVESQQLTHGVIISEHFHDTPALTFRYPDDIRDALRAPLLFDGRRSVLVVDPEGHARSELTRHRLARVDPGPEPEPDPGPVQMADSGALVAEATRRIGGLGFFLRADRAIWAFVDGRPVLVRRGEHWSAFPLELDAFIANLIGGGPATALVVDAAFILAAEAHGAILAITRDGDALGSVVSPKDRYDLRGTFDPDAMRAETRLHHLIDAETLDPQTVARLAALDGATIVSRKGELLAYGAIVTSTDSQHEGARTAAAKTLSLTADVALKVSEDGDITVFHSGEVIASLLGPALGNVAP